MNYINCTYTNDTRKKQIADLEKENQWLKPFGYELYLYGLSRVFNLNHNIPIDEFSLHNGVKYAENWWKLYTLHNDNVPEEKKDLIMKEGKNLIKFIEIIFLDYLKKQIKNLPHNIHYILKRN